MERLLRAVMSPSAGAVVFIVGLIVFYGMGTWYVAPEMSPRTRSDMTVLPWLSVVGVAIGSAFSGRQSHTLFLDRRGRFVVYGTTLAFVAFCTIVIASATSLPIVEAWKGAS